jgi:protein involved in polysaccharide export with SLBB domain
MDASGSNSMAEFELKSVLDGPDGPGPNADFHVLPYDVVTVAATAPPRLVHIVGEVTRPGSAELVTQESVSLMKMVATAGGLTRIANPGDTLIMHISPEGIQTSTSIVDLGKIMKGKSKDIDLISGDIVMVPSSRAKVISGMITGPMLSVGLSSLLLGRF